MYRFSGLDSLMASKGINSSTVFTAYLNEVFSKRESQEANLEGFVWDTPQLDFTYEMLEAGRNVEVMASYVDLNSPAIPYGKLNKLSILKGTIPRMKASVVRGENDYRKQLIALNEVKSIANFSNKNESVAINSFLSKQLFLAVDDIVSAFKNSLNYQVGQMKSNAGLTLTDDNNPYGSIRASFKANVPEDNHFVKTWFTDSNGTESPGSTPVDDIRNFVRELKWKVNGYSNVAIEMSEKFLYKLLSHTDVLKAVGYALTGIGLRYTKANDDNAVAVARGTALDAQKEALRRVLEVDEIITSKTVCVAEKPSVAEGVISLDAFQDGVVLVRPKGTIGVIKNVAPLRPDSQAIVGSIYDGRGIIEYMYNRDTREQRWMGELTALAVPIRPKDMYYFHAYGSKASSASTLSVDGETLSVDSETE